MKNELAYIKKILNRDVGQYLIDVSDFFDNRSNLFYNYFKNNAPLSQADISELNRLYDLCKSILGDFNTNKEKLKANMNYWDIVELVDDSYTKLSSIKNFNKWSRSTFSIFNNSKVKIDFSLRQNQSFEDLAEDLGFDDKENEWVGLAVNNLIKEEDYTKDGGNKIQVYFRNKLDFSIDSVVGDLSGVKMYGSGISNEFIIENNDIKVLSNEETILQAFSTYLNLKRGGLPYQPNVGVEEGLLGSNKNNIQYPMLLRQIASSFSLDDRFNELSVLDIKSENDVIFITFEVRTRLGESLTQNYQLL